MKDATVWHQSLGVLGEWAEPNGEDITPSSSLHMKQKCESEPKSNRGKPRSKITSKALSVTVLLLIRGCMHLPKWDKSLFDQFEYAPFKKWNTGFSNINNYLKKNSFHGVITDAKARLSYIADTSTKSAICTRTPSSIKLEEYRRDRFTADNQKKGRWPGKESRQHKKRE